MKYFFTNYYYSVLFKLFIISLSLSVFPLTAQGKFNYKSVVAPPILKMSTPEVWEGKGKNIGKLSIPISTDDELVQQYVRQGFALIHAQWDLEAYRHFSAALKRDPDCLMAYCGIVICLLDPNHEWKTYRARAINRMVTLAESKSGKKYIFPANERDYAIAIGSLVVNGVNAGAASFKVLAEKYPNDLQLSLLAAYFNRGKYNSFNSPDLKQEQALKIIKGLLDKYPNNPLVINFYVMMLIDAPAKAVDQKKEVLPYVKKMIALGGAEFPGWQMLLGYSALRAGETELARDAYVKAATLFEAWRKKSKVEISECDGLMRAYSFLAFIHHQLRENTKFDQVVKKMDEGIKARKSSTIYASYTTIQKMMPFNILIAKGDSKSITEALKLLPKVDSKNKDKRFINLIIKAYQAYALARSNHFNGKKEKSSIMAIKLNKTLREIGKLRGEARKLKNYGQCIVLYQALKIYHSELIAEMIGELGEYNYYAQASEMQMQTSRYYPPFILYPMEYKLGKYYERKGDNKKARGAYKAALERMPSHPESITSYGKLMDLLED